jgi:uncharacterized protein (DUF302 family)/uncharacterized membrane protein YidH (DUF202 family)
MPARMADQEAKRRDGEMESPAEMKPRADLRDYLAAERTFLAWIRTGLALMRFGFVVARLGVFLQQPQVLQRAAHASSYGLSLWFGNALIAVGVVVNLSSAWHCARLVRALDKGDPPRCSPLALNVAIALLLALVGLAMAIRLVSVRGFSSIHADNGEEKAMTQATNKGIIDRPSNHSVDETVNRLKNLLESKGIILFGLVDHSGEAEKVGMNMRPTTLLIFGSPKAGTPVMLAAPSIAIDLPLKILIWEDAQGKVWVSYNSPTYLQERHGVPPELLPNIAAVEMLAAKAGE